MKYIYTILLLLMFTNVVSAGVSSMGADSIVAASESAKKSSSKKSSSKKNSPNIRTAVLKDGTSYVGTMRGRRPHA